MTDLETTIRQIIHEELRDELAAIFNGFATFIAVPPKTRDTIPAPPAKQRPRGQRKAKRAEPPVDIEASRQRATHELGGILLGYFTAPTAPLSWSAGELCQAIGGEPRDIGRHLQRLAKAGELVMTGSRRRARYALPERQRAVSNGATP
jgi:hypothetical protein